MVDKETIIQVLGGIMQRPDLLAEKDRYSLTPDDFPNKFEKIIFVSLHNLYEQGAKKISEIDVDVFLNTNPTHKKIFEANDGIGYLSDIREYSEPENFPFYYNRLKKLNLLKDLNKMGISTTHIYDPRLDTDKSQEINSRFEEMKITDIIELIKKNLSKIESEYGAGDTSQVKTANVGLRELIEELKLSPENGAPLQGHIFNTIAKGARKGKYYIRSAASSVGKTRLALGDACYLAFPLRFNPQNWEWELCGSNEKTLFITTEQEVDEIQTMILAYLTGFNEEKFLYGKYTVEEEKVVEDALKVAEHFKDNLHLVQMPSPTIEKIKAVVRQNVLVNQVENVFYDYLSIGVNLLDEFRDLKLRNDETLLMFSTALKDLAVELGVFVMTATQLNAKGEDSENGEIKNESAIRGSRAIIDKADIGVIISRINPKEFDLLEQLELPVTPNQVTDVFKVRRGRFTQVRIWSYVDLGTCRKEDLILTDSFYRKIDGFVPMRFVRDGDEFLALKKFKETLESGNR